MCYDGAAEVTAVVEGVCQARGVPAVPCDSAETAIPQALQSGHPVIAFGSPYMAGAVRTAFPPVYRKWLRKSKIAARDALTPAERQEKSHAICQAILASPEFQRAHTVLLYRAARGEASLEELRTAPESAGKRLVYPLCISGTEMAAVLPGEDAWRPGSFGILEPVLERSTVIDPADVDLILCPCTVFDGECHRMGMGGGFYDRFLPKCENAAVAAAAFECQKAAAVPVESWDRPMEKVFTETAVYERGKRPC